MAEIADIPAPSPDLAVPAGTKRVHIKTFGCQMNVYDSERMEEALAPLGYVATERAEDADLIVLNTCHIRERAVEKVYSQIGRLRDLKEGRRAEGGELMIAVAGCVAQAEGVEIARRAPAVDLVFGPQSYHRLPGLLERARNTSRTVVDTEFPEEDKFEHLPKRTPKRSVSAFLTVQEGCDKFCTFCVVPYTRGAEVSRPVDRLLEEARQLGEAGVRELTLLGQNVNAYHGRGPGGESWSLARLVRALASIEGLERLRYTTSHPRDMGEDLIAEHRDNTKLMPYLHLPIQSGSDRVLAAMNRRHTVDEYLRLVERVREARPDIALSTDIIVGFPGETEREFAATLALIERAQHIQAFTFKYSPRPGTPAASLDGQVPHQVMVERLARVQELIDRRQAAFCQSMVGRTLPVLFDKPGRRAGQIGGRSPYLHVVHAEGPLAALGHIRAVTISAGGRVSLEGVIKPA